MDYLGVHSIVCWSPGVSQVFKPVGGRWELTGSGVEDLTLVGKSNSILLNGAGSCGAHFFITNGEIVGA